MRSQTWNRPAYSHAQERAAAAASFAPDSYAADDHALFALLKRAFKIVIVCAVLLAILGQDRGRLFAAAGDGARSLIAQVQGAKD
jgi:hypothetical protein